MKNTILLVISKISPIKMVFMLSMLLSILASFYFFQKDYIIAYGDSESHLNIAKRVVHSLTPGFSQLGGIWLPLTHLLMVPFVYFDPLWRTGLAGAIVSGISFIISGVFIYKITYLLTNKISAAILSALVFLLNPNILYMQATPMTELNLIAFFVLSTYFYIKFLKNDRDLLSLIFAAFFGFCATLTRYDGWFLVLFESLCLVGVYGFKHYKILEGKFILFASLAFFGILLWLAWDFLILGDPFYFTNSQFSAKSQQQSWLLRGELPAYQNLPLSVLYYLVTSISNYGILVSVFSFIGLVYYFIYERNKEKNLILLLLLVPFIFNVITLYLGQSVIFIPSLTPASFEWQLFNVRYGMMMIPTFAFFFGYLSTKIFKPLQFLLIAIIIIQIGLFATGFSKILSLEDGLAGLSAAKKPDAQYWLEKNYDGGLVLVDDYARTLSIVRTNIPMQNVIYIGNKPYWEESLKEPEKYAKWVVMQKDDTVWVSILGRKEVEDRLYKYFQKVYTSPEVLIFKRTST